MSDLIDLDLNPDLYDDEGDKDVELSDSNSAIESEPVRTGNNVENDDSNDSDFEEVDIYPVTQVTLPFDQSYALHESRFTNNPSDELTLGQQSKLVNYVDERLLQIQRKYIKSQAAESETYSFPALSQELSQIIEILWLPIQKRVQLFGQVDYMVRILSDLEDYLMHYPPVFAIEDTTPIISPQDKAKFIEYFNFFSSFDVKLSIIFDGYVGLNGSRWKMGGTQMVRIAPIITRLRIIITDSIEPRRNKLNSLYAGKNGKVRQEAKELIDTLDVECGRLFEGLIERIN